MPYEYDDIVRQFYEELKPLFINYLRKNFPLDYDQVMDIYADVWIAVRRNIIEGRVKKGTKWKAYIMKMGWYQADKLVKRSPVEHISRDDVRFDHHDFEQLYAREKEAESSIYDDPEMHSVLAAELSYIPDPCNKILKMYYYEEMSMTEIADSMNYSTPRSAITIKNRCFDRLKQRVRNAVQRLGILN